MSQTIAEKIFEARIPAAPPTKFERERAAFHRLLPQLLTTHRGQYVAIHDERVVASGEDQMEVAVRVLKQVGSVPIYVHRVADGEEPVSRSGVRRIHCGGAGGK